MDFHLSAQTTHSSQATHFQLCLLEAVAVFKTSCGFFLKEAVELREHNGSSGLIMCWFDHRQGG